MTAARHPKVTKMRQMAWKSWETWGNQGFFQTCHRSSDDTLSCFCSFPYFHWNFFPSFIQFFCRLWHILPWISLVIPQALSNWPCPLGLWAWRGGRHRWRFDALALGRTDGATWRRVWCWWFDGGRHWSLIGRKLKNLREIVRKSEWQWLLTEDDRKMLLDGQYNTSSCLERH